jgi:hypothetical protein
MISVTGRCCCDSIPGVNASDGFTDRYSNTHSTVTKGHVVVQFRANGIHCGAKPLRFSLFKDLPYQVWPGLGLLQKVR